MIFSRPAIQGFSLLFLLLIFISGTSLSQNGLLHVLVIDDAVNQLLPGASIRILETNIRKYTDSNGLASFGPLAAGRYSVAVHHVAYGDVERSVSFAGGGDDSIVFRMQPAMLRSEEVIVRSSRTGSALTSTPYPLEMKMSDELVRRPDVTISDVLKDSPGIALVRDGTWETALSIRGLSRANIVSMVDNTRIETSDDIAGSLSFINMHDVERVEVIKSSGSSLYGSGALGGVVRFVTKRASFSDEGRSSADYTAAASSVNGAISQHLSVENSNDRFALRVSAGRRNAGVVTTPEGVIPNSQYSDFSMYGSLTAKTAGDQSIILSYQRSQAENTGIPGGDPIAQSASARYTLARRELLGLEYDFPNLSPRIPLLVFRFSRQEIDRNVEIIQNPALTLTPHATHATMNAGVEARFAPDEKELLTVGVEACQRDLESKRERRNTMNGDLVGERPVPSSTFFSGGLYAQNEWHAANTPVTLIAGARYDRIRVNNDAAWNPDYVIEGGIFNATPQNRQMLWAKTSVDNESWSVNGGATYALSREAEVTFLSATSFRSPSLEERFQFIDLGNFVRVGNPNLQPERSVSFNAGISLHPADARIQADVFLNQLSNLVTEIPGTFEGRAAYVKANIGEARLYGWEVSGERKLMRWGALRFSGSYVRGEETRSNSNLPDLSPFHGEVGLSMAAAGWGRFNVSSSYAFRKNQTAAGELAIPGYAVFDAGFASTPIDFWRMSLSVRAGIENILNKDYRNFISTLRGVALDEPGRNFYLSAGVAL